MTVNDLIGAMHAMIGALSPEQRDEPLRDVRIAVERRDGAPDGEVVILRLRFGDDGCGYAVLRDPNMDARLAMEVETMMTDPRNRTRFEEGRIIVDHANGIEWRDD